MKDTLSAYLNELEAETFDIRDVETKDAFMLVASASSTSSTSCCSTTSCAMCSSSNTWAP